jgi:hypothetical protein
LEIPYKGRKVLSASYLASGTKLKFSQTDGSFTVQMPLENQESMVTVVKLSVK